MFLFLYFRLVNANRDPDAVLAHRQTVERRRERCDENNRADSPPCNREDEQRDDEEILPRHQNDEFRGGPNRQNVERRRKKLDENNSRNAILTNEEDDGWLWMIDFVSDDDDDYGWWWTEDSIDDDDNDFVEVDSSSSDSWWNDLYIAYLY